MNIAKVQGFMDALNLDIAVERVGENETVPQRWVEGAYHYRAMLSRPGAREYHYQFSTKGLERALTGAEVLLCMAITAVDYQRHPTLEAYCAYTGAPIEDVAEMWHTFEPEHRALMRFFGERYAEFLELAADV